MERLRSGSVGNGLVVLLVLSCADREARLAEILDGLGVEFLRVRGYWEARALLQTHPLLGAVVTDATLEDGNWCDVLRAVVDYDPQASVVMIAPSSADEILWSEVMWRGVHDILVEPFTNSEAQRILEGALRVAGGQKHRLIGGSRSKLPQEYSHDSFQFERRRRARRKAPNTT